MKYGVAVGVIVKADDPENLGRVQIRIPMITGGDRWARVVRPPVKSDFLLPEVGDEVLIAFESGSLDRPFVIGSLWNGSDRPASG